MEKKNNFPHHCSLGCRWPCAFRNRPWYIGTDGLWFIDDNGCGTWNNVSRPKDNQYTTSECVERRGSFFVVRWVLIKLVHNLLSNYLIDNSSTTMINKILYNSG